MEKIIILTTNQSRRNSLVSMLGETVKFDALCQAEVSRELGEELISKFTDIKFVSVVEEGKLDQTIKQKMNVDSTSKVGELELEVQRLRKENEQLKGEVEQLKGELLQKSTIQDDSQSLKGVEEVKGERVVETGGLEKENFSEDEIRAKKLEIKKQYISLKKLDLVDIVKQSNFPESEWLELNKDNLLDYIVGKMFEDSQKTK